MSQYTHYRSPRKGRETHNQKSYLKEKKAKKLPKYEEAHGMHFQEAQRTTTRINSRRPSLRYIIIKLSNSKTENLNSRKRKVIVHI